MKEFNELFERLNNHKATPSDELFTFLFIFGFPVALFCIGLIIKLIIDKFKRM